MDKARRFTGRQITTMVVAAAIAVVAAPVGAMAATGSFVNITDPVNAAQKARVDASGHLEVGDGSGALTVDGATRPMAPGAPWWSSMDVGPADMMALVGPSSAAVNFTSLSITMDASSTGSRDVRIAAKNVPSSATICDPNVGTVDGTMWHARGLRASQGAYLSFPSPLQWRPPSGMKVCIYAWSDADAAVTGLATVNASGYYGA
jgi:hypothetical protein